MTDVRKPYDGPAGGWGALAASLHHVRKEDIVTLGSLTMMRANQPAGFDCPGCAWPDHTGHSIDFCENGVKAVAFEATAHRVTREFFAQHTVSELLTHDDYWLESQGRLTEPMLYSADDDRYHPVGWDDAFATIAGHLKALSSPNDAVFYTSGRTSNEAAFLYQLFAREFGTNNMPDCSNMCHEPTSVALAEQIGIGKGTVTLEDFSKAEAIFIFGQNPGTNHPRMLGDLRSAARRGARIVVFNPLRERGLERFANPQSPVEMATGGSTRIATNYYQVKIGGDLAVARGIARSVIEHGALDETFIAEHTKGFTEFRDSLMRESWEAIETASGLSRIQIEEAAAIYATSSATIVCWGMGITQHHHAVGTIQTLIDLLLLKGNIGKPGAGACPVRGHSNVQGDRTMGIWERPKPEFLDALQKTFGFEPPREVGHDVVGTVEAMLRNEVRVFFAMGGNFAVATPDTQRTEAAIRSCDLTVQVSTKLNRSHLIVGKQALILPCLGRSERDLQAGGEQAVSVEDSMSMVHLSAGKNDPASPHLKSEPAIVAGLASATLPNSRVPWTELVENYDRIRACIAEVVPGFKNFNERVRAPGGFYLGNSARERRWSPQGGRVQFQVHELPAVPVSARADLMLTTIRSHDQFNTTIYGLRDRYRGIDGVRDVCFIGRADLDRLGMKPGERVDIVSVWDDGERVVQHFQLVEYDLPAGCIAAYYPECNPLVPLSSFADRARTPASKSVPVRLQRSVAEPTR